MGAARSAVAGFVQAKLAGHIGASGYNFATRELLHGVSGGLAGAILSKDAKEGAISIALAAVVATTVAHATKVDKGTIAKSVIDKANAEGTPLTPESLHPMIQAEIKGTIDFSILSGAVATFLSGHDVGVGIETATTAVVNNCAVMIERQVLEEVLQQTADVIPGYIDSTGEWIKNNPELVALAADGFVAFSVQMADDGGRKPPKTKASRKADKIVKDGINSAAKVVGRDLKKFAQWMRNRSKSSGGTANATATKSHGNSRRYVGDTHVYVVRDSEGNIHKVGESMRGVNKSGKSLRAENQRRKLERQTGERFETEIRETFPNKNAARKWETKTIKKYRTYFGDDKLPGNKGDR